MTVRADIKDWCRLAHVVDAIRKVQAFTEGWDLARFLASELVQDAVLKNLEVIGEATNNLSANILEGISDDEYRRIVNLRNVLAHEYFRVDLASIWDVVATKLSLLEESADLAMRELQRRNPDLAKP